MIDGIPDVPASRCPRTMSRLIPVYASKVLHGHFVIRREGSKKL
jgi:hypothetical protein